MPSVNWEERKMGIPFIFTMYGVNHVHQVWLKYDICCIFTVNTSRFFTIIIMVKIKS